MAERRMFTKLVTDDDNFMGLSSSAQALYLHLTMSADDDGFCNQVSLSMFKAHASIQDLEALLEKRYIYQFENGVIVIKHWRMANALRKDRYTKTVFLDELAKLEINENGSYSWLPDGCQMVAKRLPDGCQMVADRLPQDRLDKNRIDKDRLDKREDTRSRFVKPTLDQVEEYIHEQGYEVDGEKFIDYYDSVGWTVGKNKPMKDWKAAVRTWAKTEKTHQIYDHAKQKNEPKKNTFNDFEQRTYDFDDLEMKLMSKLHGRDLTKG